MSDLAEDCRTAAQGLKRSPMLTSILNDASYEIERLRLQVDHLEQLSKMDAPLTFCGVEITEAAKVVLSHRAAPAPRE